MTSPERLPLVLDATALREGSVLGQGGQGRVVEITTINGHRHGIPLVAKWYLPSVRVDPTALTRLVSWRRALPTADRATVDGLTAWPHAVLVRRERAAGILLPRVPPHFEEQVRLPSGGLRRTLRELQFLIAGEQALRRRGFTDPDLAARWQVLARFAEAVAVLHEHQVVLGDLSVKNVLWRAGNGQADVHLLDCDAMRLTGTVPAVPQPNSPGWQDPAYPSTQNQLSDIYKLALVVVRVLVRDFHTRDPEQVAPLLGRHLTSLVRASMSGRPQDRPPAAVWPPLLHEKAAEAGGAFRHEDKDVTHD